MNDQRKQEESREQRPVQAGHRRGVRIGRRHRVGAVVVMAVLCVGPAVSVAGASVGTTPTPPQNTAAPRPPRGPAVTGGMLRTGTRRLVLQLACRHDGKLTLRQGTHTLGMRRFGCHHYRGSVSVRLPRRVARAGFHAGGVHLRARIVSGRARVTRTVTMMLPPWRDSDSATPRTTQPPAFTGAGPQLSGFGASKSLASNAITGWWSDTAAQCVGSGSGSGGGIVVAPYPWALLDAAAYGEPVWWRAWVWAWDPVSQQGQWADITGGWLSYTPHPDGAEVDGSIYDDGLVVIGGTTAPGVYLDPANGTVGAGWWVQPYIEAYSRSAGDMWHLVPIDTATSVQVADPNWCYFS